jgi:hypothetical protein
MTIFARSVSRKEEITGLPVINAIFGTTWSVWDLKNFLMKMRSSIALIVWILHPTISVAHRVIFLERT